MIASLKLSLPVLALLAFAGPAGAAPVVATPNIPSGLAGVNFALCQATNFGKKPAMITIEIVNSDNNTAVNVVNPVLVDPGESKVVTVGGFIPNSYCRVTGLAKTKTAVSFSHLNNTMPVVFVTAP